MIRRLRDDVASCGLALVMVLLAGTRPLVASAETQREDEYRVKAAMLFNIAKFIDWPPAAFSGPPAPLNVCVLGVDPFGGTLDEALKGRVGGRAIATRRIADVEPGCH